MSKYPVPSIVNRSEWEAQLAELTEREKAATRQLDRLAAERRRLPMVRIEKDYRFGGENGEASLLELFEGRKQLIVYHFMFGPDWEEGCDGCSWVTDAMTHPAHLNARDVTLVLVSRAELPKLLQYKKRMGWHDLSWYSSAGSSFNQDFGASHDEDEHHGASVFLQHEGAVYQTYYTTNRGIEHLGSHWTWLDLAPYGRQEDWEDSPQGYPQTPAHWTRRHDQYS